MSHPVELAIKRLAYCLAESHLPFDGVEVALPPGLYDDLAKSLEAKSHATEGFSRLAPLKLYLGGGYIAVRRRPL